eukprot:GHVU01225769.1.p1 GENE.GHVU01225769.1~~GHVU01225769.1.p1  ORF type:complete len:387 (-),score=94.22 GHVU01225769.1:882-1892(-)
MAKQQRCMCRHTPPPDSARGAFSECARGACIAKAAGQNGCGHGTNYYLYDVGAAYVGCYGLDDAFVASVKLAHERADNDYARCRSACAHTGAVFAAIAGERCFCGAAAFAASRWTPGFCRTCSDSSLGCGASGAAVSVYRLTRGVRTAGLLMEQSPPPQQPGGSPTEQPPPVTAATGPSAGQLPGQQGGGDKTEPAKPTAGTDDVDWFDGQSVQDLLMRLTTTTTAQEETKKISTAVVVGASVGGLALVAALGGGVYYIANQSNDEPGTDDETLPLVDDEHFSYAQQEWAPPPMMQPAPPPMQPAAPPPMQGGPPPMQGGPPPMQGGPPPTDGDFF